MEEVKQGEESVEVLPAVAAKLRDWLPELEGRALAVTGADIEPDNLPTLPLAMVAPVEQVFGQTNGQRRLNIVEDFDISVWLSPARYKSDKGETPFWSYYEYNKFRDRLFDALAGWRVPGCGQLQMLRMDVAAEVFATILTFRCRASYIVDSDADPDEPPAKITFNLCAPASQDCAPVCEEEKPKCP